ncbi:MAG TPA: YHS domain-containing protein [Planctomycetaceae bacterium]|nr:YHS domain-containing protein [Planctomycetaceae bacterium]
MNPQLRRAAKACLLSTVTGALLVPGHMALAQSAARITHADAEEAAGLEPAPLNTLGPASPMPLRGERSVATSADKKVVPPKGKGTTKTKLKPAATKSAAAKSTVGADTIRSAAAPSDAKSESIEQTAAQVRPAPYASPYSAQAPAQGFDAQSTAQPSAPMSPVEKELQELYRKNGRQMPDMNLQEFATPSTPPAPTQAPANPYAGRGTPAPAQRSAAKTSKPNFFERVFGFGRARQKSATPARSAPPSKIGLPPGQGYAPPGQRPAAPQNPNYTPPGQASTVPGNQGTSSVPQLAPFRPNGAMPNPSPTQQPQPYTPMREPAPLAPAGEPVPTARQPGTTPLSNRDVQALIDESKLQGDSESLELSQDDDTTAKRQVPQILPNNSAERPAESPYTGLTINPHESENGIARTDELEKSLEDKQGGIGAPSAAPAGDSALKHPLAGAQKPATPAAPATKSAKPDDDDEMLELDDEDEDDDDDKDDQPGKSSADESLSIPGDEKPVFPRETGAEPSRAAPATTAPAEKEKEKAVRKLATAGALKGFKGFCPVLLKDERRLVEARSQFKTEYRGQTYTFSSREAKQTFDTNPQKYAPAGGGKDVVRLAGGDEESEGSLEHAAWYRGKLFLFSSAETRREFIDAPSRFNVND